VLAKTVLGILAKTLKIGKRMNAKPICTATGTCPSDVTQPEKVKP